MEQLSETLKNTVQYSSPQSLKDNSNSTVLSTVQVLSSVTDLIINDDYNPWYAKYVRQLGCSRFMELANKARAGSDTPGVLFKWMLENNQIVK